MRNICNSRNGGAFSCFLRFLTQDIYFRTLIPIYDYLRDAGAVHEMHRRYKNLAIKIDYDRLSFIEDIHLPIVEKRCFSTGEER